MVFTFLRFVTVGVKPQLQWLLYSPILSAFVSGDDSIAYAVGSDAASSPRRLSPFRSNDAASSDSHPCNLPMPAEVYEEYRDSPWHGFRFLRASEYDHAADVGRTHTSRGHCSSHSRDDWKDVAPTPADQTQQARERLLASEPHSIVRTAITKLRQSA